MTIDQDYNIYRATKELQGSLTLIDGGVNKPETIEYFVGWLKEAARRWQLNIEDIRRYGAELQRDITRTLSYVNQGYGIDVSNRLGQRADDYNRAVSVSRDLAHDVQARADALWKVLGENETVQERLTSYIDTLFASVKVGE